MKKRNNLRKIGSVSLIFVLSFTIAGSKLMITHAEEVNEEEQQTVSTEKIKSELEEETPVVVSEEEPKSESEEETPEEEILEEVSEEEPDSESEEEISSEVSEEELKSESEEETSLEVSEEELKSESEEETSLEVSEEEPKSESEEEILVGQQNAAIMLTSLEEEPQTTNSSEAKKVVDAAGVELSEEETQKINDLLESIEKTEGFVVYADTIDRTNHIEGNVCVNEVESYGANIVLNRVTETEEGDYSYVGNSNGGIQISDSSNIIVGSEITVSKPNGNQTIINGGYSNNITVTQLDDEETKQMEETIKNNLSEISAAGEAAKAEIDEAFYGESDNAFESVNNMLENDVLTKGDIVSINVDYKSILNNEGAFGNLLNNNNGTTVVVNIIMTEENITDITIVKAFTANTKVSTDFNQYAPYIVWNFGSYNGNITICEEMVGIIVAPEATVYQAAGNLNGQIIANTAGNNGEIHQVTKKEESSSEEESSEEESSEEESSEEESSEEESSEEESSEEESSEEESSEEESSEEESSEEESSEEESSEEESSEEESSEEESSEEESSEEESSEEESSEEESSEEESSEEESSEEESSEEESSEEEPSEEESSEEESSEEESSEEESSEEESSEEESSEEESSEEESSEEESSEEESSEEESSEEESSEEESSEEESSEEESSEESSTEEKSEPSTETPQSQKQSETTSESIETVEPPVEETSTIPETPETPEIPEQKEETYEIPRTGENDMEYVLIFIMLASGILGVKLVKSSKHEEE